MKLTLRKAAFGLALTGSIIGVSATSASALHCVNVSRAVPPQPAAPVFNQSGVATIWVVQGDWWYITFGGGPFGNAVWDKVPPGSWVNVLGFSPAAAAALGLPAGTVKGNYQAGQGPGELLQNAQAPCNANRQTQHGIQADCVKQ
jgi:hypothetical protein